MIGNAIYSKHDYFNILVTYRGVVSNLKISYLNKKLTLTHYQTLLSLFLRILQQKNNIISLIVLPWPAAFALKAFLSFAGISKIIRSAPSVYAFSFLCFFF